MSEPRNVLAIREWYRQHAPSNLEAFDDMVEAAKSTLTRSGRLAEIMLALALQGFEAGRLFEREHPEVESGIGYLPDVQPRRKLTMDAGGKLVSGRKLGETQRSVIHALDQHGAWQHPCGWVWDTPSGTVKILESLRRRGLVRTTKGVYTLTDAGRSYLPESK